MINNRMQRCSSRFFTISSQRREQSPTCTLKWPGRSRAQIMCNTSNAYHVQHVLRATWYAGTAQLLSLTRVEIAFISTFFLLAYPLTDDTCFTDCGLCHQAPNSSSPASSTSSSQLPAATRKADSDGEGDGQALSKRPRREVVMPRRYLD